MKYKIVCLLTIASMIIGSMTTTTYAVSAADGNINNGKKFVQKKDNLPDPLTTKQQDLKKKALEAKLNGKAIGKTHEVAKGQYVELEREGEGAIWTVLGEFSDFEHNSLPEPDREVDNTTIWEPDFSKDYFHDLLFSEEPGTNSMRNYYIEQSSNRYAVYGDVTDWIKVPHEAAYYDDNPDSNVWLFLEDTVNGWYKEQLDAGISTDKINEYLKQYDVRDRYDYDGDGDFDEPDGYIDTFQSVHAGEGEEAGGGTLGDDAIWSHSWYARSGLVGIAGPSFNMLGGIQIGDSDYWVGKYTIQPENGGVGVFTHEYGHDLGLPDLYDTSGGENGTGFWTLMSSGSWMSDGTKDIGSKPSHMGAWEKLQFGWLNYEVTKASKKPLSFKLGPMEFNTKQPQALFVVLPEKSVTTVISDPYAGSNFYYSGSGDDLDNFMTKQIDVTSGTAISAMVNYDIEEDWDYAYLVVSTDGGATWTNIETNLSTDDDPNGQNYGNGITGTSDGWVELIADLSAYEGPITIGFRYWTDGASGGVGFMVDDININGFPIDGAETDEGWTFDGFKVTTGTESGLFSNYYIAEYRTYKGYDSTLKVGPYNFGFLDNELLANWAEHFAYQDGLLINYWDTSQSDNATADHPGHGLVLPIDAHYHALKRSDGKIWRNRIQTYDSTFTTTATDGIPDLHLNSILSPVESLPAANVFDDSILHYDDTNPQGSVIHPNTGTIIDVRSMDSNGFIQIQVRSAKSSKNK
ncbi:immune inhibitor A domain-containing protein [Sedimentibacter sp. B4]|uniref:immune inhibitor A domain-containing protein n=1 Tax=Sedimentibacter sp. B4 TaxID=304766 RepID=UPI00031997EB|nr:immune inhibitor A domain-containing protein [Sedimentibacter sp. B4]